MPKQKVDWVVMGGKPGEVAFCTRCGEGILLGLPVRMEVLLAASNAFVKCHADCEPGQYTPPPTTTPQEWLAGRDTGISSRTIYGVMTATPIHRRDHGYPHDPADFGRCYRLLQLFPAWRRRLAEVAVMYPGPWTRLIAQWDELTALYEAELPKGTAPKLYDRMRELIQERTA